MTTSRRLSDLDLSALKALAEKATKAIDRMHEDGRGIGGLAVVDPEMANDWRVWSFASDSEHADTVLALLAALKEAQADNARLTQLAEGRSKLGLLAVYMSDVVDDADMVAARDAYLADVWDAGWHEHYLEMDRQKHDRFHPITKTNPYRNGGTK